MDTIPKAPVLPNEVDIFRHIRPSQYPYIIFPSTSEGRKCGILKTATILGCRVCNTKSGFKCSRCLVTANILTIY